MELGGIGCCQPVGKLTKESSPLIDAGRRRLFSFSLAALLGPGMLVSLADTDAACLMVAADSGARYGYSALVLLQIVLAPVLFLAQELTVRLGIHTGKGHCSCIRDRFGPRWAWGTYILLLISCVGGTVSELNGIASVLQLWGLSEVCGTLLGAAVLLALVCALPYRGVEAVAILFGLGECALFVAMGMARPSLSELFGGLLTFSSEGQFYQLAAANIGAGAQPVPHTCTLNPSVAAWQRGSVAAWQRGS
jgi:Mn2+/Fe2+ NRAMP family transporter